jgi:putative membrane protein
MIVYQSNKNWLRDVRHLFSSWTMQKVVRSTVFVMAYTALVSLLQLEVVQIENGGLDVTIFSLLGVVLSILLSFRTNTAYDRWWEGRKLWGELVK